MADDLGWTDIGSFGSEVKTPNIDTLAAEGGIRSPLIIVGPGVKGQRQTDAFAYITDIMPTMLEMATLKHPSKFQGREVKSMRGRSISKVLSTTSH